MINKVLHTIKCHQMIATQDKVLIGLSGGADSMALAFFLNTLKDSWGFSLEAVHVNHMLRGAEAVRDQHFVQDWCAAHNIVCHVVVKDIAAIATAQGVSTELAGRNVRYEIFHSFGMDYKIATAHHLDDSIETVLFHLVRGTSPDGMTGIPAVRGNIIRPLIHCTRLEIEAYCAANKIPYVTDSTNFTEDYTRNRLRNEVVPVLKELNPSMEQAMARFFTLAGQDKQYLEEQAQKAYQTVLQDEGLDCSKLMLLPPALRGRVIRLFLQDKFHFDAQWKHISAVEEVALNGGKTQLSQDLSLKCFKHRLISTKTEEFDSPGFQIVNKLVMSRKEFLNISEKKKNTFDFCADYDKIKGKVSVRSRKAGDKITLPGRNCTKTLKKYFNEIGIPAEARSAVPVLTDTVGIIGLPGLTCDSRVQPGADTSQFLLLKVGDKDEE